MSLPLIDPLLKLATAVVDGYNLQESRRYVEAIRKTRLEILEERGRGDRADQAKIAHLYKELDIHLEALSQDVMAAMVAEK